MKSILKLVVLTGLFASAAVVAKADISDAHGIKDACVAGALLDADRIPYRVVVFHASTRDEAGCIYKANGDSYLYTPMGSAKVDADEVDEIPLENVSRADVYKIADGDRDMKNGCLVYATCAYSEYKRNPHITWAGVIAARIVNVNNYGGDEGSGRLNLTGHAITAFENDHREIFIQENGDKPEKLDDMTERAQAGDKSWHDSSTLIYCDHHIQGITTFNCQFGRPW